MPPRLQLQAAVDAAPIGREEQCNSFRTVERSAAVAGLFGDSCHNVGGYRPAPTIGAASRRIDHPSPPLRGTSAVITIASCAPATQDLDEGMGSAGWAWAPVSAARAGQGGGLRGGGRGPFVRGDRPVSGGFRSTRWSGWGFRRAVCWVCGRRRPWKPCAVWPRGSALARRGAEGHPAQPYPPPAPANTPHRRRERHASAGARH